MGSLFDDQVTGQRRAPPATAEGRWSRRPRERPGQRPRPTLGTPGPPVVPGQIPGGAGPARADPAVPRPARRPPPATTETCGAHRASGGQRSASRPSHKAGADRPAHPWLPVRSGRVAGEGRQPGPAPLRSPTPRPPGPTPGRASPRAAAAARVPDRGRASDPDVPAPAALSPLRSFPPSRLGAERERAILSLGPIRL